MVKLLLKKGADTEAASTEEIQFFGKINGKMQGTRALHLAAGLGGTTMASVLLQAGANPNVKNGEGRTPLMYSCEFWDKEQRVTMAQLLVETGANLLLLDDDGQVPLHFAARRGYLPMIDFFLAKSPSALSQPAGKGQTPLAIAAQRGHEEAVSRLLSAGARSRVFFDNHLCALHGAAEQGHESIVRLLVDRGMEAMGGANSLPGALQCAVEQDFSRILQILLNAEGEGRQRHFANFNCPSFPPLLHHATRYVAISCVSALLAAGADETVLDRDGKHSIDVVGNSLQGSKKRDPKKEAAICRMLARGSAFRARSWTWPVGRAASAAAAARVNISRGKKATATAPLGVRAFRPRGGRPFVRTIER